MFLTIFDIIFLIWLIYRIIAFPDRTFENLVLCMLLIILLNIQKG